MMENSGFKFTKAQKDILLRNLDIEVQARIEKLESQSILARKSLRERIEMRINRVPKKNWDMILRGSIEKKKSDTSHKQILRKKTRRQQRNVVSSKVR